MPKEQGSELLPLHLAIGGLALTAACLSFEALSGTYHPILYVLASLGTSYTVIDGALFYHDKVDQRANVKLSEGVNMAKLYDYDLAISQGMEQLAKLRAQDKLLKTGCQTAMVLGILGILFIPTLEGKALSGMLFTGGAGILEAPFKKT